MNRAIGIVIATAHTAQALSASAPDAFGISAKDTILPIVPMFHVMSWGLPFAAMMGGITLIMPDRFLQPEPLAQMIEQLGVTSGSGVPTIWNGLLQHLDGRLATVRLNLDENTRLKGMRHFVATEEHARHGQNSMAQHIAQGVIFLIKHKGGRIWYAHVLLHLDALLPRLEEEQGISIGRVRHADAVMLVAAAQAQASAGIRHIPL